MSTELVNAATVAVNFVGLLGFAAAVAVLASVPARPDRRFNEHTKTFAIAAFAIYVYSLAIDLFGRYLSSPLLEEIENFVEVLFPVFMLMSVVAMLSAQQVIDVRRAQAALKASHDMMYAIVDSAPAGIMVLDPAGRATFANETARQVLDFGDEEGTGALVTPGWTVFDRQGRGRPDFRALVTGPTAGSQALSVQWPSGWRVDLQVNVEPLGAASAPGGYVATFERPRRTG